ncbi:MAG: FAD-dependent oxidoreductase [Candidatus Gottesmanbacteria bacterium]|nr:FAD-dependent oxidoreductase [Candidatus Gottesmanbacteria bacterium]
MNVAIIGGGFTGLSAAYELTKRGHEVTLFERDKVLGGLAYGFNPPAGGWDWSLEYSYHHWFTNDRTVLGLIKELGLKDKLIIRRPVTANLYNGKPYQLDSPIHLLLFPGLSMIDKLRTAAILAFLKLNPFWKPLENITAEHFLCSLGGKRAYKVLWEPLLVGKFGDLAPCVQAAWFWARIKKRTPNLMYMEGGFHTLITALEKTIKKQGGKIYTNTRAAVKELSGFDKILLTIPQAQTPPIPHLWAQTLILETKEPILKDVYWLNITDRSFPFLAAVAHTNFMDKKHYGGHHLTYFGNYLPQGHPYLSMTKEQLLKKFMPFIKRLCPTMNYELITNNFLSVGPFAQPVHELHYSQRVPKLETPISNVYLANMDSIVPWDRGVNYAIELGKKAAKTIYFN